MIMHNAPVDSIEGSEKLCTACAFKMEPNHNEYVACIIIFN